MLMQQGWLHAKLLFVLLLTGIHMMMARWRREFAEDRNHRSQRFFRIMNEVPAVLMLGIVIFVIVRPF
jgi:putative membrane protein